MNTDNLSALAVGIGVVALIAGFGIYFNSPDLNNASGQQDTFVPSAVLQENGTITKVQIDKSQFKKAPELAGISGYINTEPITLAELKGKVVLVDFWTYSCINCIRTIPYLNAWYEKYTDQGLVIVGVHTPEFEFEKNIDNVNAAVEKYGIKYPVVQDNDKDTWKAFENRYWPRKYLVDDEGYIRYDHIGEGSYAETEKVIQSLLTERAVNSGQTININGSISQPDSVQSVEFNKIRTPELYFGYQFARAPLGNPEGFNSDEVVSYSIQDNSAIKSNTIYLSGEWKNNKDSMELQGQAGKIVLAYSAKSVNIVAGGQGELKIVENDVQLTGDGRGSDVSDNGSVVVDGQRLYNIAKHDDYGTRTIEITAIGQGFQIYTFTFG
ncbi:MAG TPA: thioredoxin family protein [Nitrososphaera sp.]|jgi:thiol-disulfide isomerase/thioredoxin|nr:thioredoxin family protein [Nitrososphaera sp.]